ncbi:GerMN domain-containing protein [Neobacillus ginsengisoli]|uniref:Germination protein M n=1 Tax=Neobacillus ginsengisoli TaxID=904295 RepID=A0ABT9XNI9_9BACI|nr:GerMN domain-containing protein [Neobacillus ginsengisoli]MDQ0197103.1 germination protein M [Neobacillus ginsengisoli]
MSKNKAITLVTAMFASSVLLSGCGLFGSEVQKKIDPPKSVAVTDKNVNKDTASKKENAQGLVKTELYLIDKNGYVVPQTLALPKTASPAKQALEYLVTNGPVSEMLPNGFRSVLPADTSLSVAIKDGVATVDFSKEFKNYQAADELKILQSVTWTLTQFNTIKQVKLQMAGHELTAMPVKGTPISENLSRANGINIDTADVTDITNTKPVTVYYIGGVEGSYYYVPVTRRVSNNEKDNIVAVVNELIQGPSEKSNLLSEFMSDVKLLGTPKLENGKVTLDFNENIYGSFKKNMISQHLLDTLVLSLTEQNGINQVAVTVKGKAGLVNENGKKLTAPVTRPEKVNTGSF